MEKFVILVQKLSIISLKLTSVWKENLFQILLLWKNSQMLNRQKIIQLLALKNRFLKLLYLLYHATRQSLFSTVKNVLVVILILNMI
jgi:hypothetical protein